MTDANRTEVERQACLLMFSGGRDSTVAALRLARSGIPLVLVTVTSGHLIGIERVRQRVREMRAIIEPETAWICVKQPTDLRTDTSFYYQTCLPCHHAYVVASAAIARTLGMNRLAFGYAGYQSSWPEQTPLAIERLTLVLARHGIELLLPVRDLASREAASAELEKHGLSGNALEQKCLQQVTNIALPEDLLRRQVDLWEKAIDRSMTQVDEIKIETLERTNLGSSA